MLGKGQEPGEGRRWIGHNMIVIFKVLGVYIAGVHLFHAAYAPRYLFGHSCGVALVWRCGTCVAV
eukprot:364304-Chlamydomonas_euryale.AAC.4